MLGWHFVENGVNPPPLRHFVRSPTVGLVMNWQIGDGLVDLSRVGIVLAD